MRNFKKAYILTFIFITMGIFLCQNLYALRVPLASGQDKENLGQKIQYSMREEKTGKITVEAKTTVGKIDGYDNKEDRKGKRSGYGEGFHNRPSIRLEDALLTYSKLIKENFGFQIKFYGANADSGLEVSMTNDIGLPMLALKKHNTIAVKLELEKSLPKDILEYMLFNILRAFEDENFCHEDRDGLYASGKKLEQMIKNPNPDIKYINRSGSDSNL